MKKGFLILCCLLLLASCSFAEEPEIRGYVKKEGWQYIQLGSYPYEKDGTRAPVVWRVLGVEEQQLFAISEYILDIQQVIYCDNMKDSDKRKFRKISDYGESDLNVWMNETMLPRLCEEQDFSPALVETQYGLLYPPTTDQMLTEAYGFPNVRYGVEFKARQAYATPYAKIVKLYENYGTSRFTLYVDHDYHTSPYWVATVKNPDDYKLQLCGYDGHLSYGVYTRVNVGVRPAITLKLDLCRVDSGSGTLEDPFVLSLTKK